MAWRLNASHCNVALGFMRDDPERLRRAADYLEKEKGRCTNHRPTSSIDGQTASLAAPPGPPWSRSDAQPACQSSAADCAAATASGLASGDEGL